MTKKFTSLKGLILTAAVFLIIGIVIGTQFSEKLSALRCRVREVIISGPHTFSLEGKIYYPRSFPGVKHPGILFLHGTLPKGKDTRLYKALLKELAKSGYLVLTFDLRGFGDSYKVSNFRVPEDLDFAADVKSALRYMIEKLPVDKKNITIAGHSLGGNLSFAVGAVSPEVRNIISIAPGNYEFPEHYSPKRKQQYISKLETAVGHSISVKYWERLARPLNLFQYLPIKGPKNVYLILADGDWPDVVRYTEKLFNELKTEKALVIIPHSNHNFGAEYFKGNEIIDLGPVRTLAEEIDTLLRSG